MKITKHIDWISVSMLSGLSCGGIFPECDWRLVGEGSHGWQKRYECMRTGMISEEANPREDMHNHLTVSGSALSAFRVMTNLTDFEILSRLDDHKGRCSRLDICGNVHGGRLTPRRLKDAFADKKASSTIRKRYIIEGTDDEFDGDTFYMGSKESQVQARFYDKNAERKIKSDVSWKRLEFQLRDESAQNAHKAIVHSSVAAVFNAFLGRYIEFDNPDIRALLEGELAQIDEVGRKDRDTVRWLLGVVAKSLGREIAIDDTLMEHFLQNTYMYKQQYENDIVNLSLRNRTDD